MSDAKPKYQVRSHPFVGTLVCKQFSQRVVDATDAANERKDAAGNKYNIELKSISDLIP